MPEQEPDLDHPAPHPRSGILRPGGALHPGVSWTRFAVAGVIGFVFLVGVVTLALLVPESRPWTSAVGAVGFVWQWQRRRQQRQRRAAAATRD